METVRHTILLLTSDAQLRAEGDAVLIREFRRCESVILRAANGDLDGAHERSNTPRGLPVESAKDAVNQAGAIGVTATRRVEHFPRAGAGNLVSAAGGVNGGALAAASDDERLHVLHHVRDRPASPLLQQGPFVVVQRQP